MRIIETSIYKFSIPMAPFTIATGTMYFAQNILVKIKTANGIVGYGECSAFPVIAGETQNTCFELAKDFAGLWKGKDALALDERLQELDLYIACNYTAKSAFDMALYDIAAKKEQLPLYKFLGGEQRTIESDLTIGIGTPESMAVQALDFVRRGVTIIKVKLGKEPKEDIERIRQIRAAISNDTILRIDANQGWNYDQAVKALNGLGQFNIQFCEQPMRKYNDHLLPTLCTSSPIPLMADESVFTHYDAERIIRNNACHYINIKFAKSGGIAEAQRINAVAEKNNIQCMMGGMLESRVALTAKVHFAMASPNICFYDLDTCLLGHKEDPVIGGVSYVNGMHLQLPEEPGIGVTVDENYLSKLESVIV